MSDTSDLLMIQRMGEVHIIELLQSSMLDQHVIDRTRDGIMDVVEKSGTFKVVISFENVTHLASAMLGVLMELNKTVKEHKGQIRLASLQPNIREVFNLTALDKVLKIYDTTDKAMVKFN